MGKKKGPRPGSGGRKHRGFRVRDPHYFTPAGPVTVTKPDGTVKTQPPLGKKEYQLLVKVRGHVSDGQKARILKRDKGCCRYCGCSVGPFHIDHVVPIAMGGSNAFKNLVLACDNCNQRKGAQVWKPRPIPRGVPKEASGSREIVQESASQSDFVPKNQRPGAVRIGGRSVDCPEELADTPVRVR